MKIETNRLIIQRFNLNKIEQFKNIIKDFNSSKYAIFDRAFPKTDEGIEELVTSYLKNGYGNKLKTKLDIGVHKLLDIKQDEYCFDLSIINKNANLLINSKEQIFMEKIKSLLKLGFGSKDIKIYLNFII